MSDGSTLLDPKDRAQRGRKLAAEITGKPLAAPATPYQESWRDFIFAEVWSRPGLDRRARYLIAVAGATLCNGPSEILEGYVHGALKSRAISLIELREAALHISVYGSWGKGGNLDAAITTAVAELGLAEETTDPLRAEPWDPHSRSMQGQAEFNKVMTFRGGPGGTPYIDAINNFVFGEMWCRRALDERSRRWLTLVGVCESCAEVPIKSHIHAAMASGNCTPAEMQEFVLAYGVHAGWPKASVIQSAVIEMTRKFDAGLPWNG